MRPTGSLTADVITSSTTTMTNATNMITNANKTTINTMCFASEIWTMERVVYHMRMRPIADENAMKVLIIVMSHYADVDSAMDVAIQTFVHMDTKYIAYGWFTMLRIIREHGWDDILNRYGAWLRTRLSTLVDH